MHASAHAHVQPHMARSLPRARGSEVSPERTVLVPHLRGIRHGGSGAGKEQTRAHIASDPNTEGQGPLTVARGWTRIPRRRTSSSTWRARSLQAAVRGPVSQNRDIGTAGQCGRMFAPSCWVGGLRPARRCMAVVRRPGRQGRPRPRLERCRPADAASTPAPACHARVPPAVGPASSISAVFFRPPQSPLLPHVCSVQASTASPRRSVAPREERHICPVIWFLRLTSALQRRVRERGLAVRRVGGGLSRCRRKSPWERQSRLAPLRSLRVVPLRSKRVRGAQLQSDQLRRRQPARGSAHWPRARCDCRSALLLIICDHVSLQARPRVL